MFNLNRAQKLLTPGTVLVAKDCYGVRHIYTIVFCSPLKQTDERTTLAETSYGCLLILLNTLGYIHYANVSLIDWRSVLTTCPIKLDLGVNEFSMSFSTRESPHHTEDIIEVVK